MSNLITGQPLYTQDGRKIGNAMVVSVDRGAVSGPLYEIKTDFGNSARLNEREVNGAFYLTRGSEELVHPRLVDSPVGKKGFVIAHSTALNIQNRVYGENAPLRIEILPWKDSLENAVVQVELAVWPELVERLRLPADWL